MTQLKTVLVTGGAGYVGHVLVPQLLANDYHVVVYDTLWFGARFWPHPRLKIVKGDIRDIRAFTEAAKGCDAVINLACISNDTSFALDEKLSTSINRDAFKPLLLACRDAGIKRFINASTSSVYGVSDAPDVYEDNPKIPLTLYNRFKWECEERLQELNDPGFAWVTIRPATLCGYSPRCRLDLSVNILTNHAVNKGKILVFGGEQKRPNLHILDMVEAYKMLLRLPDEAINRKTYNCGFQNLSIAEIARIVKRVAEDEFPDRAPIEIETTESDDRRSYQINSDKIQRELGFSPRFSMEDAVRDLCKAFRDGLLSDSFDDENYYNVRRLKSLQVS
jgi:nucleoside-diphosphate-sugar epimerase